MAYGESSGHVTDDPKGQTCDPIRLEPNISNTAGQGLAI